MEQEWGLPKIEKGGSLADCRRDSELLLFKLSKICPSTARLLSAK